MPHLSVFSDILSFYKEEMAGDTANYLTLMAASRGITKLDALHEIIDKAMQVHHNILECLKPYKEAFGAYVSYFHGYIQFHLVAPRYKLGEIMSEIVVQ